MSENPPNLCSVPLSTTRSTACSPCPPGHYMNETGAAACRVCQKGKVWVWVVFSPDELASDWERLFCGARCNYQVT